ncbi:MAG: flagellar protein FliS [Epulopiscium sp.]|nr:flagellar protein FliS [Candidatus Epulonipiscium sp.]
MALNGYQQYKAQSVNTMTNGEMLILLYDEIIKRLTRAEFALQQGNITLFDESVIRARDIVRYLIDTLDRSYPISGEIARMYDFFLYEISRISAGRNAQVIQELKPLVQELRDTFKEADKIRGAH